MPKIINISGKDVKIGGDDGKIITVPIAALTFSNPKIGDEVEIFRDKKDVIVNRKKAAMKMPTLKAPASKKPFIIVGCVLAGILIVFCAIKFLPLAFDEDLRTKSSYPEYYKNLKEEKEAFAKALEACNKAAASHMSSKGITTEYEWTDLDAVNGRIEKDDDGNPYIYLPDVQPTGGNKQYKSYGARDYDCKTNITGTSVQGISILWDY